MNAHHGAVPDLSQVGRVAVAEHRILLPASVEPFDGGLVMDGGDQHLRIVEIVAGRALYVPMTDGQAHYVIRGMLDICRAHGNDYLQGDHSHEHH